MKKMAAAVKAIDLIQQMQKNEFELPEPEAIEELQKIFAYNDRTGSSCARLRISAEKVCQMLESWGYPCTRGKLHILCQKLGRKSYSHA